jgi:hypothetical protein
MVMTSDDMAIKNSSFKTSSIRRRQVMPVQAIDRHDLLQDSVSQAGAWLEKGAILLVDSMWPANRHLSP